MFSAIKIAATLLIFAATASSIRVAEQDAVMMRIWGGNDTTILEKPYMVSIQKNHVHLCGGAIVSEKFILTAAHCFDDIPMANLTVRVGSTYPKKGGEVYVPKRLIIHENYNGTFFLNDVALVELSKPILKGKSAKVIKIFRTGESPKADTVAVVNGWGRIVNGERPDTLQTLDLLIKDCKPVSKGQLCAVSKIDGTATCMGDSGSPLVIHNKVAGLTSWSNMKCDKIPYDKTTHYTDVSYYYKWITSKMRSH